MLMIYYPLKFFTTTASCGHRTALKLLLPLSFCALLLGCDSHSSSPDSDKKITVANTDSEQRDAAALEQNIEDKALNSDNNSEESESLITAAKSERKSAAGGALTDAESANKMQATLIGDYTGIVPCSFCSSTQVLLNLFADGSVVKTSAYNNPEKPTASLTENGIYRQDNDTITIVYDDQRIESYLIQNNHLALLNDDEVVDTGYTLSRQ